MKKLLVISLLAVMALSFVGCQNNSSDNSSATSEVSNTSVAVSSDNSPTDGSGESSVQSTAESITDNSASGNGFDFNNYKSEEIIDIEKVDLFAGDASYRSELESRCETYEAKY